MSNRNICTIAHVDHGKTTLVDGLFQQSGTFAAHKTAEERVMDSGDLERERGITISAKNAAFLLGETKVNIVDTPGHADFGGEVERIMSMVDGAILLVDAAEGPLPQTRFVLQKAINKGLGIIVCINKVDRSEVQGSELVSQTVNKLFDLFIELGASEEQCDFPIVYACARDGWCVRNYEDVDQFISGEKKGSLDPLFELILELPAPKVATGSEAAMVISNINYSEFVGPLALGRIVGGTFERNTVCYRHGVDDLGQPMKQKFTITRMFTYEGMEQVAVEKLEPGDIGLIAGCEDIVIGDTLGGLDQTPMERIQVESPTMRMIFSINTSPDSGREGKPLQSRELRQRLVKETMRNPALRLEDAESSDQFYLHGRGELQFGILIETLRREGLEFMVGRPGVLYRQDAELGKLEPFESLIIDIPEEHVGDVTQLFQKRKGTMEHFEILPGSTVNPRARLVFEIPTRGILGTKSDFLTVTRGMGVMNNEYIGHRPFAGAIGHRSGGSIIADRSGETTAYALEQIQQRGSMFIGEGVKVYEGMIIGQASKDADLNVNPVKPKKLTNIRTTSSDGITVLHGIRKMTLENCIEWIEDDEWIEVTPENIRLRKKVLPANQRHVRRRDA